MSRPDLRPLGFGEILDGAFTLYRRDFATLFATALIPNLPVIAFWALFPSAVAGGDEAQLSAASGAAALGLYPYAIFATFLIWGALTHQFSEAYTGGEVELGGGYGRALASLLPLVGAGVIAGIAISVGLLLFLIPGILLTIIFFAVAPAVVVEGRGAFAALARSRALAKSAWLRIFGIGLIGFTIVALPAVALATATGVGALLAGPDLLSSMDIGWTTTAAQAANTIVSALTTPYLAGCLVLVYYDRRVRTEALDLEVATDALTAEGAAR